MSEIFYREGVEFKPIRNIAEVGTGSSNKRDACEGGLYPFFVRSKNVERKNDYEFDEEAVIIPGEGGIGDIFHYVSGKYALHQRAYRIHFLDDCINTKFAKYYMESAFKEFIMRRAFNGTVASIRKPMIEDFTIPLPPLEVQRKIVEILDKFTELTRELTRELELRKKQYIYYRDKLLTFDDSVPRKTLGELGYFYGGLHGKNRYDFENGNADFITYMNVYSNIEIKPDMIQHVKISEGEKQNAVQFGDILFTGSSETLDECGMSSVMTTHNNIIYLNSFCFGFRFNDSNIILPEFAKFLFRSSELRSQIIRTAQGVTRFNVSKKKMQNVIIPLPPLDEQIRISAILDKFDSLCNDITSGIPAEIAARRKQYEYYRDKLLTFKQIDSELPQ